MILTTKVLSKTDSVIAGVAKCSYCSTSFQVGDHVVFCPSDSTPHHVKCWQANGNRCSTLGCTGEGRARSSLIIAALPSEFRAVQGGIMTKAFEAFGIPDLSKSGGNGALVVYAPPEKEGCTVIICQVNYDMANNKPVYSRFAQILDHK